MLLKFQSQLKDAAAAAEQDHPPAKRTRGSAAQSEVVKTLDNPSSVGSKVEEKKRKLELKRVFDRWVIH
jgi:hypothetical protein